MRRREFFKEKLHTTIFREASIARFDIRAEVKRLSGSLKLGYNCFITWRQSKIFRRFGGSFSVTLFAGMSI